jgi:uncharacterized membrane protein YeaQ/YmgE (transglycosylase-associated protein family)
MKNIIILLTIAISLSSCATLERSILFSSAVGAASGTGAGLIAEKSAGSALIGAGIGGIIGAAVGYLLHGRISKKEEFIKPLESSKKDDSAPSLTSPEINRIWVPEKIEGNKYIEGHYIYLIDKQSVWSQ